MTLMELRQRALFQTNNDPEDLGDFQPHLTDYVNEGYDKLLFAYTGCHLGDEFSSLSHPKASPELPEWAHTALSDYAAWCLYRNGSAPRQGRGAPFLSAFRETLAKLRAEPSARKAAPTRFINLPA